MDKPVKPIEPKPQDFSGCWRDSPSTAKSPSPFIVAYKKYQKDLERYQDAIDAYEQTKLIEDIQRSTVKLCLKKYRVIKKTKPY